MLNKLNQIVDKILDSFQVNISHFQRRFLFTEKLMVCKHLELRSNFEAILCQSNSIDYC